MFKDDKEIAKGNILPCSGHLKGIRQTYEILIVPGASQETSTGVKSDIECI